MNWHYGDPIVNGQYLCCIQGYSSPIPLYWNTEEGGWGDWDYYDSGDWIPFEKDRSLKDNYSPIVCYIGFNEIPMPENW